MLYFTKRKCYFAIRVTFLLITVTVVLKLFEKYWCENHRTFKELEENIFEKQILEDEARIVPGLGEGGVPVYLTGEDKLLGEQSEDKLRINVYLSDRIAYNRSLKDLRDSACQQMMYDAELPSASVILIFHNEPYSLLVRTIWSVVNSCRRTNSWFQQANVVDSQGRIRNLGYPGQDPNSSFLYVKEIILVDDHSTMRELQEKLKLYIKTRLPSDLVKIYRTPSRLGIPRARLAGARQAQSEVLVFLDSHCEVMVDWLRPLLQRIKKERTAVVFPEIDIIENSNFGYSDEKNKVCGFTFDGLFYWIDLPEREKKRRGSDIAPTRSPTMAGGLLAINRAYFWEIGAYDEQMSGWGGENLEMSFRIWQCGGTLESLPCSRVGHVYRVDHPFGLPAHTETLAVNAARMAEVWMDEYAALFYLFRPDLRNNSKIGDLTNRKLLRKKLQCKSFQWYLDNIYKEKFVLVQNVYGYGRFQNPATRRCLDTLQREDDEPLGLYDCHSTIQGSQLFALSLKHELRNEVCCAKAENERNRSQDVEEVNRKVRVIMTECKDEATQKHWSYNSSTSQIQHSNGKCLDTSGGREVLLRACTNSVTQQWHIDYSQDNDFRKPNDTELNASLRSLTFLKRNN